MKLSLKWLKEYINIDMPIHDFCEAMTMSGSKVEGYVQEGENIKNVVIGKILSIEQHPDADKLVVCKVDVNKGEPIQIVTGATNVFVGAVIPAALDGSVLPNGTKIKKGKLRGVESCGMMCSIGELNLTLNDFPNATEDGILIIDEPVEIGQDVQSALGLDDTCVEFEITSNRPDCLSMIGLAREASATFGQPLDIKSPVVNNTVDDIKDYISVEVENKELCNRYTARVVKNVKIAPSPRWLREKLRGCGVRPINNLVDITNYVMLEYGQPMHAFDLRFIDGAKIVVRNAKKDEKITTLDDIERELSEQMLVISDANKAVALAGVMGGLNSEIKDDTSTVVFESACFDGASVRTTAKKLGLRTESSARFEKGLDANTTLDAINRACELVQMLGAGEVVEGIIDHNFDTKKPFTMKLDEKWINSFLGTDIEKSQMESILLSLGFGVDNGVITAPSFRIDIEDKADISEEIARIYGYNNIPTTQIKGLAEGKLNDRQKFEKKIDFTLVALGCYEVITYSFISPKHYSKIGLNQDEVKSVTISNPLGEDTSVMRVTTIPSILDVLSRNYNNRNKSAWIYEIGNEYIPQQEGELPQENSQITIGMYGNNADFYTIKGAVEVLLDRLGIVDWEIRKKQDIPTFHSGRCGELFKGDEVFGIIGEIHPSVLENYEIGVKAYVAKLDVQKLFNLQKGEIQYKKLPKFPASTRDLSLVCDEQIEVGVIEKTIKASAGKILENVEIFDVYRSEQIGKDKKSVSFSLTLRSFEGTLTDEQADGAIKKVLKALSAIGVELRG
jgi:phenylalanyl-tRNA synthetase beta chain